MRYEELLKKAYEKIPKKIETKERFEVPKVVYEVSGSKTILKNFGDITSLLRRDGNHLAKFLFKEIATAGNIQGTVLIFQGKVQRDLLQKKIGEYIKEFVYCKQCGEPDTRLIKENRVNFLKCEACGAKHPVRTI